MPERAVLERTKKRGSQGCPGPGYRQKEEEISFDHSVPQIDAA
jgi:hypothetical protein